MKGHRAGPAALAAIAGLEDKVARVFETRDWHDDARRTAVADFVAGVREQLRKEFDEKLGLIRADMEIAKAHTGGDVVDLPALPSLRGARRA